jgi:hypothetical protein
VRTPCDREGFSFGILDLPLGILDLRFALDDWNSMFFDFELSTLDSELFR